MLIDMNVSSDCGMKLLSTRFVKTSRDKVVVEFS